MRKILVVTMILIAVFLILGFSIWNYYIYPINIKNTPVRKSNEQASTWKIVEKNGISMSVPEKWVSDTDSPFFVYKPDLSKKPHRADAPTQNMVMIDVTTTKTNAPLEEASKDIIKKTISNQFMANYIYEDGFINGTSVKYVYLNVSEPNLEKAQYPSYIILKSSPEDIAVISVDFFYVGDADYFNTTIKEINQILSTLKVRD
jgi:hypothetical protein